MKRLVYVLAVACFMTYVSKPCAAQNHSLDFDGVDDYVSITSNVNLSPTDAVTIEAWVKGDSASATKFIYDRVEQNDGFGLTITANGNARITINGGLVAATSAINVLDGHWNHIAGTYDMNDGMLIIYVNGVADGSSTYSAPMQYSPEPRNGIGGPGASASTFFAGAIDEVRVWNVALSAAKLQAGMCTPPNPAQEPNLIAYWRFTEGSGTTIADLTANGNNGILMNGVSWAADTACAPNAIHDAVALSSIYIFPNPMTTHATVQLPDSPNQAYRLKIFNVAGQLVQEIAPSNSGTMSINKGNLQPGLYLVQVSGNNTIIGMQKLVVR